MRIEYVKSEIKKRVNSKQYVNFDEISIQTGFNSKPHFYTVFKQFTGLTPKEYLKFCIDEKKSKRN
jgi:AraC-like DNA-binding protein